MVDGRKQRARVVRLALAGAVVLSFAGRSYGAATDARFTTPQGVAVDASGNVYVADLSSSTIRKIMKNGAVLTLAGRQYGNLDGSGSSAKFAYPSAIAVDSAGNLFVVDQNDHNVRKVTPAGVVTTFAGTTDPVNPQYGNVDATGTAARFNGPAGIAIDASGNLYVADYNNQSLRKITPAGVVTTMAAGIPGPAAVAVDAAGTAYVACADGNSVVKVTAGGAVTTLQGGLNGPQGVAVDAAGTVYVADTLNAVIRKIAGGVMTTIAGTVGHSASADGAGAAAAFEFPTGIALDGASTLYVPDYNASTIRKVTLSGGTAVVSTYAGMADQPGNADAVASPVAAPAFAPWQLGLAAAAAAAFLAWARRRRQPVLAR